MKKYNVCIVGIGAVGKEMVRLLRKREFPIEKLTILARSDRQEVIDGETVEGKGTGNGPINALDMALRGDLKRYAKTIDTMRLIDFKVRILNTGTEAVTRVTIESVDDAGDSWRTIGVNPNIVVASFEALNDAVVYKLFKDGVSAVPETA